MSGVVQAQNIERSGEVDLGGIGRAIARKKWWIIGVTLACFLGMLAFVTFTKPRYTAEAKVLLENQENYFTRPDKNMNGGEQPLALDAEAVQTQVQLMTSRDLGRRAIRELNLQGNPEFDPLAAGLGPISSVMVLLGLQRDPTRLSPEDRILESYLEKLTVFSPIKTRVLTVEFQSRDPDIAAKTANKVADLYIGVQTTAKRDSAKAAAASLNSLITELRIKVAQAEAETEAYRAANGLMAGSNNMTLSGQQLAELNTQLSLARTAQADAQAKARQIREMIRQGRATELPDVANNELIRRVSEQRVTLRAQLALESRTLLPGHPRIKELNAQLADLEGGLRAAGEKVVRTLESDARIAGSRVENLQAALESQKKVAGHASADEVRLRELERTARLMKDQLESSTAKYQEALARENSLSTPADARIISRAVAPQLPSFPKKIPMLALATIAGFVLSLGTVLASEVLSGRAYVPAATGPIEQPQVPGEVPLFARVRQAGANFAAPRVASGEGAADAAPEPVAAADAEPQAPAKSELATRILARKRLGTGTRIVASGIGSEEANHEQVVSLSRELAREGRTILVDVDWEATLIDHLVDVRADEGSAPTGLAELLAGASTFAEVIHRDRLSRLHILPAGHHPDADFSGFDLVLDALAETYDFVVMATPPLARNETAFVLAPMADFGVIEASGQTAEQKSQTAYEKMLEAGARDVLISGMEKRGSTKEAASVA